MVVLAILLFLDLDLVLVRGWFSVVLSMFSVVLDTVLSVSVLLLLLVVVVLAN